MSCPPSAVAVVAMTPSAGNTTAVNRVGWKLGQESFFSFDLFNVGLDHPGLQILTEMVQYHLSKLWWVEISQGLGLM